jgi:hypothetical protein
MVLSWFHLYYKVVLSKDVILILAFIEIAIRYYFSQYRKMTSYLLICNNCDCDFRSGWDGMMLAHMTKPFKSGHKEVVLMEALDLKLS